MLHNGYDLTKTASGRSALAMMLAAIAGLAGGRLAGDVEMQRGVGRAASNAYRSHVRPALDSGANALSGWYHQDIAPALSRGGARASEWYDQSVAPSIDPALDRFRSWANSEIVPRAQSTWTTIREASDRAFGR